MSRRLARTGAAFMVGLICFVAISHFMLGDSWLAAVVFGVIVIGFLTVAVRAWIGQDGQKRR